MRGRRGFLRASIGAGVGLLLAACGGGAPTPAPAPPTPAPAAKPTEAPKPAAAQPATSGGASASLKVLARSHFVPAFDAWWDKWAADWGSKNNATVAMDHILAGELPAKWAAEVAANTGHDLFGFTQGGAINVYNKQLADLSDVAAELGKKYGDWVDPL